MFRSMLQVSWLHSSLRPNGVYVVSKIIRFGFGHIEYNKYDRMMYSSAYYIERYSVFSRKIQYIYLVNGYFYV